MLLKYKGTQETDSIMLRYNIDNAHLIMQSVVDKYLSSLQTYLQSLTNELTLLQLIKRN